MVQIDITYEGELRCTATHTPSSTKLITDAPADNLGKAESFSPTDLVATALGTCILTTMGIVADRMQVDLKGTRITVQKEILAQPTRRIGSLKVDIHVPTNLDDIQKQKLVKAAENCPVHKSMHPDVQMPITFHWA